MVCERHRGAHPDGVRGGQVRKHLGLGGGVPEEVGGGAVVELDAAGGVVRHGGLVFGGAVGRDGGGLDQRGGSAGQPDLAVLVQGVVVRDGDRPLRGEQHAFEGLRGRLQRQAG